MPLNNVKIDVKRAFSTDRLTNMPPINVQSLFEQIRAFHGLNAINDNLVLIDRKNHMSGMIAGVEYSGKTYACKRECFNALITMDDEVIVLTKKAEEYEHFANELGGSRVYGKLPEKLLKVIQLKNDMDLVIQLSYFLDYAVRMKKKNKNIWIFVDGADELLYSTTGSDFAIALLDRTEKLHVPVTLVIDDSVYIFTNQDASIEFDYLLNKMNYFKLLGLGPIERKEFIEKLNIADMLIPYITDREPGEGIIITSTSNIPFTDRLGDEKHPFYKLFF